MPPRNFGGPMRDQLRQAARQAGPQRSSQPIRSMMFMEPQLLRGLSRAPLSADAIEPEPEQSFFQRYRLPILGGGAVVLAGGMIFIAKRKGWI